MNGSHSSRVFVVAAAALAVALVSPSRSQAHDLKASVNALADPIRVEAGFDDDTPADGARVEVTDAEGRTIASGVLDDKGLWSFPKPGPGSYRIVVELAGHRDAIRLVIPEAVPPEVVADWRLDKNLGLVIGLALLLGGSAAFVLLRRSRRREAVAPLAAPARES